jgi:hypothetical protein
MYLDKNPVGQSNRMQHFFTPSLIVPEHEVLHVRARVEGHAAWRDALVLVVVTCTFDI